MGVADGLKSGIIGDRGRADRRPGHPRRDRGPVRDRPPDRRAVPDPVRPRRARRCVRARPAPDRARAGSRPARLPAAAPLQRAAVETPVRELRTNLAPILRLSIGLVLFTMALVAVVAHSAIPGLGWPAAFTLGAIVAPTDALAATRSSGGSGRRARSSRSSKASRCSTTRPRSSPIGPRSLAAVSGAFVAVRRARRRSSIAAVGGIAIGVVVGRVAGEILRRLDDPPVEVVISLVIPFAAYLPADRLGLSGVLAAVAAGLVIGSRLGTILSPNSRVLWLTHLEDGRVRPQRLRVRADRARAARDPRRPRRPSPRARSSA